MMKMVRHLNARRVQMHPIDAHVKKIKTVEAYQKKTTSIRTELSGGCYMVTYYYKRGPYGELLAEDVDHATHFERAVYDPMGHMLGSTTGELTDKIRW